MNTIALDEKLVSLLTDKTVENVYKNLIQKKTDIFDGNVAIAKGCDGIDYVQFGKNIKVHSDVICNKGKNGKYLFTPFREVVVPKPPYENHQLEQAKKEGKTRTLSVSIIQDTIFQDIVSQVITPYAEQIFAEEIDLNSFAYRKDKSSKMAIKLIRNNVDQGYMNILDGDIEKFFDMIDHELLLKKCIKLFGENNKLILRCLYRFMNVSRIPDGQLKEYKESNGKMGFSKRLVGIPQGGVLSGLLANIFLFDFDKYVIGTLQKQYDFKYIRYADDFVLMFKNDNNIVEIFGLLQKFLEEEKLHLHDLGKKTKILNLSIEKKDTLDFLGFEVSPRFLRVKHANIKKFYNRLTEVIRPIEATNVEVYLLEVAARIKPKIVGLEDVLSVNGYCPVCNNLLPKRNWVGYFMIIDDVRSLRNMDAHLRKIIYKDYHFKTKKHLKKKELLSVKNTLLSLEKMYYIYKKQERKIKLNKLSYCTCIRYFDKEKNMLIVEASNVKSNL